jgi:tetratricopeptide (TPR) repeat protein
VPFFDEEIIMRTGEGREHARELLSLPRTDWEGALRFHPEYRIPETFYAAADLIAAKTEREPRPALEDALELYRLLEPIAGEIAEFDEPDSLLGEVALVVGRAYRVLDETELAERWLNRALEAFSRTYRPEPELANVRYQVGAVRLHQRREEEALQNSRQSQQFFARYRMDAEYWNSRTLEAICLRHFGRIEQATRILEEAVAFYKEKGNDGSAAHCLKILGDLLLESGDFLRGTPLMKEAVKRYQRADNRFGLLSARWSIADAARLSGRLDLAATLFAQVIQGYSDAGMPKWSAGLRLIQAETLLQLDRPAEAEWQVRKALPYLDHPDAAPEAAAAILLLKKSLEMRQLGVGILRRARGALQIPDFQTQRPSAAAPPPSVQASPEPPAWVAPKISDAARALAEKLLTTPRGEWSAAIEADASLLEPETLLAACEVIVKKIDRSPKDALEDAEALYQLASSSGVLTAIGPDVLGEMALTVARAYRVLDQTELAERWLDTAEKSFKETINPAPCMAKAKLLRVLVRIHQRREQEGLALCREAEAVLNRYGMQDELWRSRFLGAICLDALGRPREAIPMLEQAIDYFETTGNHEFAARSLQTLGNIHADSGAFAEATPLMERAADYFRQTGNRVALLQVKWGIAEAVRVSGNLRASVPLFEEIIQGYFELQMPNWAAGLRLIQAETLLQLERPAEAEWQVRQALPYLDHPDGAPEAAAAILLLKKALDMRRLEVGVLRQARSTLLVSDASARVDVSSRLEAPPQPSDPPKWTPPEISDAARLRAEKLLATPREERSAATLEDALFLESETLLAACELIVKKTERMPQAAADDAEALYNLASESAGPNRIGPEVLGEMALTVGRAYRVLDQTELAERWLDIAEKAFQETINPAPCIARLGLLRATLRRQQLRGTEALALSREVQVTFSRYGLQNELWKSRYFEGLCLKDVGESDKAAKIFEQAITFFEECNDQDNAARCMQNLGDLLAERGDFGKAIPLMKGAAAHFVATGNRLGVLQAKWGVADAVRLSGNLAAAVPLFEEVVQDYLEAQMPNWASGLRLVLAEIFLDLDREAQGEWQVRQALPYLDRLEAEPTALAAVLLLKRALRSRSLDIDTIRKSRSALESFTLRKSDLH